MTLIKYFNIIFYSLLTSSALYAAPTTNSIEQRHSSNTHTNCIPEKEWWIPAENKTLPEKKLLKKISSQRVILLGEHHNNAAHHRWHLQTIKSLYASNNNIALGFEMFPRRLQPVLDEWIQGELKQNEFIEKLSWDDYWFFDISLYMPIFEFARQNKIPMHALNVERSLMENVRKLGWKAIPENEREGLTDPAVPGRDYLTILAASYLRHNPVTPHKAGTESYDSSKDGEKFFLFVQGQLLWDRAMAEGIATAVSHSEETLFIGMMGSWHIINRLGVPHQLSSLGIDNAAILVPWDSHFDCSQITPTFADAIYGSPSSQ